MLIKFEKIKILEDFYNVRLNNFISFFARNITVMEGRYA